MLLVGYKPAFIRAFRKLPPDLQREVRERIGVNEAALEGALMLDRVEEDDACRQP